MWQQILGHDRIAEQFRRAAGRNRLAGSYLFTGPGGVGKRTFAVALAKSVLCQGRSVLDFDACGTCSSCRQIDTRNHPDLIVVSKPEDKSMIPVDLFIGEKEKRGKSGLCYEISRKSYAGGYKIAIVDDADDLNQEGANALLKTLEEPPPRAILILIGTSAAKQLPTIRSRCKVIRFFPLTPRHLAQLLCLQGIVESEERALRVAGSADGGLDHAKLFGDGALDEIRDHLFKEIALGVPHSVGFALKLNEFVEAAGKEAILRRQRLRLVLQITLDFYQNVERLLWGFDPGKLPNREMLPYFQKTVNTYQDDSTRVIRGSECTLTALEQIDRNVQISYIIDRWLQELSNI